MNAIVGSHLVDTTALRADDFDSFYKARKAALVKLVERAMGKSVSAVAGEAQTGEAEDEVPSSVVLCGDGSKAMSL